MTQKSLNNEAVSHIDLEASSYVRGFDWDKLKSFYYVAKLGNISRAAHLFNTSQSSFSRHITGLESQLGYPLFSRDRIGVTLTHRGQELYSIVDKIFFNLKSYTNRMRGCLGPNQKRKIRIATSHVLASYYINGLILEYNKKHPEIVFELLEMDDPIDVILHDVDIAIQPPISKNDNESWQIIQDPLFPLRMKLYASRRYLKQYWLPQSIEDLKQHHLIIPSTHDGYIFADTRRVLEFTREINIKAQNLVFHSNSLECLIEAAQQDKGIICTYENMKILKNADLVNILPELTIQQCEKFFIYPKFLEKDKIVMDLKKYLTQRLYQASC